MNISSLIKVFGIAAAGFVPQAQANPFGISFVKVDPPKDKKEQAICFRLKLSQTDVFSEHNFTDITFRPDTTVFLQKNMVIEDEEEVLKKTFKNFNAEKDPFEIPDKYLPLEDKDRAEWVDKDGKPLKFLVAAIFYEQYDWIDGTLNLCISGCPKRASFFISGRVMFLDGADCVIPEAMGIFASNSTKSLDKLKLKRKRKICCIISPRGSNGDEFECAESIIHIDGSYFQIQHMSSDLDFSGVFGKSKIHCPFVFYEEKEIFKMSSGGGVPFKRRFYGDLAVFAYFNASTKFYQDLDPQFGIEGCVEEGEVVRKTTEGALFAKFWHNVHTGFVDLDKCSKLPEAGGDAFWGANVQLFVLLFPKDQPKE